MATDALIRVVLQGDEAVAGADRMTQALGRMERSEPTRALRSTRTAIDELASSAAGLNPALARVQQQQLLLALTGYKGVNVQVLSAGGDTARIAYQLGRDARTDSQGRIPPGWSG